MDETEDQRLRARLHEAVDPLLPADRWAAIGARARRAARRRRAGLVGAGAVLAAAATVGVVVVVARPDVPTATDPASPPSSVPSAPTPSGAPEQELPVYYVGPGPSGPDAPRATLYRALETGTSPLALLMTTPGDPDYRTLWPEGSLVSSTVTAAGIEVTVGAGAPVDDALAQQQLVRSLQAAAGTDAPVLLVEEPGADVVRRLEPSDDLAVLSHMNITEPAEGTVVPAGTDAFTATGLGNSFEAAGVCLLRGGDGFVSEPYAVQMTGWMEPRLFPWELSIDVHDLPPGSYTLECRTDDPTGGAEGRGTDTDTRTVILE